MNSVTVTGPPSISGNVGTPQDPWYIWTFPVVVNGQAGVATIGNYSNDPADTSIMQNAIIQDLENDASDLGGISSNDGPGTDEDRDDDRDDDRTDDDDDDSALASNDGGDDGDSGDSV